MSKRALPVGCALIAALCALPAFAQVNFKSTMPDGKVIYGDKPAPGAAKVEQLKGPPSKGVTISTPRDREALQKLEGARAGRQADSARVRAAEDAMKRAEAAMAAGKEPGEGDRIGTVSGAQRFSDQYWARQKRLAQEYEVARANYERAVRESSAASTPQAAPRAGAVGADGTGGGTPGSAGATPGRRGQ